MRNSSLVEVLGVDNNRVSGIKLSAEAAGYTVSVGEHSILRRRRSVRYAGAYGKANVGISNDKGGVKPPRRKTKVS